MDLSKTSFNSQLNIIYLLNYYVPDVSLCCRLDSYWLKLKSYKWKMSRFLTVIFSFSSLLLFFFLASTCGREKLKWEYYLREVSLRKQKAPFMQLYYFPIMECVQVQLTTGWDKLFPLMTVKIFYLARSIYDMLPWTSSLYFRFAVLQPFLQIIFIQ